MSDAVKWALLAAAAVALIAIVTTLPFVEFIDLAELEAAMTGITAIAGDAFIFARGLLNNFLTPFGRSLFSGIMVWLFGKWALTVGIKLAVWSYHFIFK